MGLSGEPCHYNGNEPLTNSAVPYWIEGWTIDISYLVDDSACSSPSQTITGVTGADFKFTDDVYFDWACTEQLIIPFSRPIITNPTDCDDFDAHVWSYSFLNNNLLTSNVNPLFRIAINSIDDKIIVESADPSGPNPGSESYNLMINSFLYNK